MFLPPCFCGLDRESPQGFVFLHQQRSFYKKDFASRCNLLVRENSDTGVASFLLSRSFQSTSLIAVFDFIAQRHDMEMDNPKIRVFACCPHSYL